VLEHQVLSSGRPTMVSKEPTPPLGAPITFLTPVALRTNEEALRLGLGTVEERGPF